MKCVKCDRCGKIEPSPDGHAAALILTRDADEGRLTVERDLCDECARELRRWMAARHE